MPSVNCLTAGLTLYNKTPARCVLASSRVSYLSVSAPVTCCHLLFRRVLVLRQNRLRVHKSWHLRRFQGPRAWRETRPREVREVWSSPCWMAHFAQQPPSKKKKKKHTAVVWAVWRLTSRLCCLCTARRSSVCLRMDHSGENKPGLVCALVPVCKSAVRQIISLAWIPNFNFAFFFFFPKETVRHDWAWLLLFAFYWGGSQGGVWGPLLPSINQGGSCAGSEPSPTLDPALPQECRQHFTCLEQRTAHVSGRVIMTEDQLKTTHHFWLIHWCQRGPAKPGAACVKSRCRHMCSIADNAGEKETFAVSEWCVSGTWTSKRVFLKVHTLNQLWDSTCISTWSQRGVGGDSWGAQ